LVRPTSGYSRLPDRAPSLLRACLLGAGRLGRARPCGAFGHGTDRPQRLHRAAEARTAWPRLRGRDTRGRGSLPRHWVTQLPDCDSPGKATTDAQRDIRAPGQWGWILALWNPHDCLGGLRCSRLTRLARCVSGYGADPVASGRLEDTAVGIPCGRGGAGGDVPFGRGVRLAPILGIP
jgi:hypothetical protein